MSCSAPDGVELEGQPERTIEAGPPAEIGGSPDVANPEQLYAAALAACMHQTVVLAATREGADATDASVQVRVRLV